MFEGSFYTSLRPIVCRLLVFVDISGKQFIHSRATVPIMCCKRLSHHFRTSLHVISSDIDFALCRF